VVCCLKWRRLSIGTLRAVRNGTYAQNHRRATHFGTPTLSPGSVWQVPLKSLGYL
jgi:hypothetical protein